MGSLGAATVIGRADELQRLRECVDGIGPGGSVVLLEGDAGAGKSRLLEELQPTAIGCALEYARAPYAPVRDLIVALDRRSPAVLQGGGADVAAIAPILDLCAPQVSLADAGSHRRLLDAVVNVIAKFTRREPIVLALEDAHWIDAASAEVFAHLGRAARSMALLLIVTYRGGDAAEREESRALVAQLARQASVSIPLRPLSTADAMQLINEAAQSALPLPVRRRICELAQGNPLLLIELARHAGQDPQSLETSLPVSLQALVQDRLDIFNERERDTLRVCAAMETFELGTICGITNTPAADILGTLRKARNTGLLTEEAGRFVFRHALIRGAISNDLLGVQLADIHARIARRLEEEEGRDSANAARLAYHWHMAADVERAQRYNERAAEEALLLYAYDDAAAFLERAIGHRAVDETTFELYARLAEAHRLAGRHRQCADTYRKLVTYASEHLPIDEATRLAVELSRACFRGLDDEGSLAAVRHALAACGVDDRPSLLFELHGLLGWYLVYLRRLDEARESLDLAARHAEHAGAIPLMRYHEARAAYEVHARDGGNWRQEIDRVLEIARTLSAADQVTRHTNAMMLAVASNVDAYDFALALDERVREIILARPTTSDGTALLHESSVCWVQYVTGRLADARATITRLLPYVHDSARFAFSTVAVGIPLALKTGDDALLRACARRNILDEAFASRDPIIFGRVAAAVAEQLLAQDRAGEAIALVENTLHRLTSAGNNLDIVLLAGRIGSPPCVKKAQELLQPWIGRSRSAQAVWHLLRAHLSRGKERMNFARAAADGFATLPWPLHQAQALVLANAPEDAAAIYARVGADAEVVRLKKMRRSVIAAKLSKREHEVAQLIAQGCSNRAIADALVLSERTVENHVGSIFTKLNLRSRAEIASLMARENASTV